MVYGVGWWRGRVLRDGRGVYKCGLPPSGLIEFLLVLLTLTLDDISTSTPYHSSISFNHLSAT